MRCRRLADAVCLFLLSMAGPGCAVVSDLPAPGEVFTRIEPEFGRQYHIYVPTRYRADQPAPLVVTCHGTPPWDTAERQLTEWKGLAEQKNFLVAAPVLIGTRGDFPPAPAEQLRRQREDEEAILSMLKMIRAAYRVHEFRVFLTGWSAGNYAVLYTGLKHPEVFRALSVRQGNFEEAYVEPCVPFLDRYQPVQIIFGDFDPVDDSEEIVEWFHRQDVNPDTLEIAGIHRRDLAPAAYAFFADVVRKRPMMRVEVSETPQQPLRVRFRLRTSFEPEQYLWVFGDGQRSDAARPEHTYEQEGEYLVKVAAWTAGGKPFTRHVVLQVPSLRLGVGETASAE